MKALHKKVCTTMLVATTKVMHVFVFLFFYCKSLNLRAFHYVKVVVSWILYQDL